VGSIAIFVVNDKDCFHLGIAATGALLDEAIPLHPFAHRGIVFGNGLFRPPRNP
jgi:hypothetical protein